MGQLTHATTDALRNEMDAARREVNKRLAIVASALDAYAAALLDPDVDHRLEREGVLYQAARACDLAREHERLVAGYETTVRCLLGNDRGYTWNEG